MEEAKTWWENLPEELKSQFPHLNPNEEEVLAWFTDPAEYSLPANITY